MAESAPLTFLCITTYEKGQEFMRECKRQGCRVFLLTAETLRNAEWPRESLDDVFYIPADLPLPEIVKAVTYLSREKKIDRIVALDEFDMETASTLREHMRIPGMGLTTMRYFMPVDFGPYPHILAYLRRISDREAYQRAMKKGDPGMALLLT